MTTFTIRVTSPAVNAAGTGFGQSQDLGAPSFWDMVVTNSTDPKLPNGTYDAYCLNPFLGLNFSPKTTTASVAAGSGIGSLTNYLQAGVTTSITEEKIARINWVLAQNFTSDSKYSGQFNYGEVQSAIWQILGYSESDYNVGLNPGLLSANGRQVVNAGDVAFLVNQSLLAIQSGVNQLPTNTFFTEVIDPLDSGQPLIIQLQSAKLGNYVWEDSDGNGIQNSGELGVDHVVVQLFDDQGNLIASTATGDDFSTVAVEKGYYQFTGLAAGNYQVKFIKPSDMVFTTSNADGNSQDALDSDAAIDNNGDGLSQIVTLTAGESNQTIDAGLIRNLSSISGFVYCDDDNDGIKDNGEVGLGGVPVRLQGTNDLGQSVDLTLNTNPDGSYSFTGLRPGSYSVTEVSQPIGKLDGKDTAGTINGVTSGTAGNEVISNIVLGAGQASVNNNFGEINPAPGIDIEKTTNGTTNSNPIAPDYDNEDAANGAGVPVLTVGSNVTWTYKVANTGNTNFAKSAISIVDDNGTTSNTADDMTIANGKIVYQSGDANNDNILNVGESWIYKANGIVQQLGGSLGTATTFNLAGNTAIDGTDGNKLTFTSGGISVDATAWSRDKGTDNWQKAYLGSYSGGLGVTDSSSGENNGSGNQHTVDNNGRDNYIVFKFSQNVVVDKAYLGYVVGDSDLSVYVGSSNTALTSMNNAVLSSLTKEFNDTDLTTARWADFNSANNQGNVLIISARDDGHSMDYFKLEKLVAQAVQSGGIYVNKATVAAGGVSDFDLSHYKTAQAAPVVQKIGDYVWEDKNFNGIQDGGETGIGGVTVKLYSANGTFLRSTTTDGAGKYGFDVEAGSYKVEVIKPNGYFVTKQDQGSNDGKDSDINSSGMTGTITVTAGQDNLTIDAGLYRKASIGDRVWEDSDHDGIQDVGEYSIAGIKVNLLNSSGTVIGSTTTNSSGNYQFINLDPGTYSLQFDKYNVSHYSYWGSWYNMNNWKWGTKDVSLNAYDSKDSDVNNSGSTTRYAFTDQTFLESGENDMTWDAAITPIVIDLNGNGVQTVARANSIGQFDLLGNGKAIDSGWLSQDDGFLAIDANGNGNIDDISELFGGQNKGDGFAKLANFDSNADGLIDFNDIDFASLKIWQDANGNHQTDAGELMSLTDAGVVSLNVGFTELPFLDAQGNLHLERSVATMSDGSSADMTDVYFNISAEDAASTGVEVGSLAQLLGNDPLWM